MDKTLFPPKLVQEIDHPSVPKMRRPAGLEGVAPTEVKPVRNGTPGGVSCSGDSSSSSSWERLGWWSASDWTVRRSKRCLRRRKRASAILPRSW